jgi:hypothetical protein
MDELLPGMKDGKSEKQRSRGEQNRSAQYAADPNRKESASEEGRVNGSQRRRTPRPLCKGAVKRADSFNGGIVRNQIGLTRNLIASHRDNLEQLEAQLEQLEEMLACLDQSDVE